MSAMVLYRITKGSFDLTGWGLFVLFILLTSIEECCRRGRR